MTYYIEYGFQKDLTIAVSAVSLFLTAVIVKIWSASYCFKNLKYNIIFIAAASSVVILSLMSVPKKNSAPPYLTSQNLRITAIQSLTASQLISCSDPVAGINTVSYFPKETKAEVGSVINSIVQLEILHIHDKNREQMLRKGISHSFKYNKAMIISQPAKGTLSSRLRNAICGIIDKKLTVQSGAYLKALLFGNRNYLEKKFLYYSKRCGVLHVFAASGLHVGIAVFIPMIILFFLPRKIRYVVSLFPVGIYLFLSGFPVSLLRASIMFFCISYSVIRNRETNPFNCLFISSIIILVMHPFELYSLGFQLSFSATLAILLFFNKTYCLFPGLPLKLSSSLSMSVSVQIFTAPLLFMYFREVNMNSLISNIFFIPLITLVFSSGIACLVTPDTWKIFLFIKPVFSFFCRITFTLAETLSDLPFYFSGKCSGIFLVMVPIFLLMIFTKIRRLYTFLIFFISFLVSTVAYKVLSPEIKDLSIEYNNSTMVVGKNLIIPLDYESILNFYFSHSVKKVTVYIDTSSRENISVVLNLIKHISVDKVIINESMSFCSSSYYLFDALEKENIRFDIIKIDNYYNK